MLPWLLLLVLSCRGAQQGKAGGAGTAAAGEGAGAVTPTAAAGVGSSVFLFWLLQKVPLEIGRRRQTAAQPPAWQGVPCEHGLQL